MNDYKFYFTVFDGQTNETIIFDSDGDVTAPFGAVIYGEKNVAISAVLEKIAEIMKDGE